MPDQKKPRVLLGLATYDHLKVQTFMCLEALDRSQTDAQMVVTHRVIIDRARVGIAEQALRENYDYLLFVDDDMTFDPDALNRLIARDKDIVGGLFFGRVEPSMHLIFRFTETEKGTTCEKVEIDDLLAAEKNGECIEVDGIGTGFTLIKVDVLRKIRDAYPDHPFFTTVNRGTQFMSEDLYFCAMAKKVGATVWCDTSVKVGHIGEKTYDFAEFKANAEKYKRIVAYKRKQDAKKAS